MTLRHRYQGGTTLIEILVSMAVVIVGMLGLYKAIGTAQMGSAAAQRHTQALARAQQVMEAIRKAPSSPNNILNCLAQKGSAATAADWTLCEANCLTDLQAMNIAASPQSCVFANLLKAGQVLDSTFQNYVVVFNNDQGIGRSTWVMNAPQGYVCQSPTCVFDIQITIGWNDDGSADYDTVTGGGGHRVTIRGAMFP